MGKSETIMTATDHANQAILTAHQEDIDRIAQERGLQAAVDYANRLPGLDLSAGCVGGDGQYWQRQGYPE
jgi:hypothetical protein